MVVRVSTARLEIGTGGTGDLIDLTRKISAALQASGMKRGTLTVFVQGSTAAITSFEYEPGLIGDIKDMFERIAPQQKHYSHDETWGDANGFSHVRASLQGPSLTVPFEAGQLLLGTWQQIVLAEFDTRPRERVVVLTLTGE